MLTVNVVVDVECVCLLLACTGGEPSAASVVALLKLSRVRVLHGCETVCAQFAVLFRAVVVCGMMGRGSRRYGLDGMVMVKDLLRGKDKSAKSKKETPF